MDGSSPCAGRVEMLERDRWGSICDDNWDLQDGHVVCGQLGCGWAIQVLPGLYFPPGQGPIHRDLVNCSGDEAFLWDCPGLLGRNYCGHKEDAGVVCSGQWEALGDAGGMQMRFRILETWSGWAGSEQGGRGREAQMRF